MTGGEYINMVYSCLPSKAILMVGLWCGWRSVLKQSPSDIASGLGPWSQGQDSYKKNRGCECWSCQCSPRSWWRKWRNSYIGASASPKWQLFLLSRPVGTDLDVIWFYKSKHAFFSPNINEKIINHCLLYRSKLEYIW